MGIRLVKHSGTGGSGLVIENHDALLNRDLKDQHPIHAVTGLQETLDILEDKVQQVRKDLSVYIDTRCDKITNIINGMLEQMEVIKSDLNAIHNTINNLNVIRGTEETYSIKHDYDVSSKILKSNVKIWSGEDNTSNNAIQVLTDGLYVPSVKTQNSKTIRWAEESDGETLKEIYTSGTRFSHNGTWDNIKNTSEANAWQWNEALQSFIQPKNTKTFTGFVSKNSYDCYRHSVRIRSNDSDNDTNGVIIAYVTDNEGRPHTLSAIVHRQDGAGNSWKLVYDFMLPDQQVLFTCGNGNNGCVPAGYSDKGWNTIQEGVTIYVTKFHNIITATASAWNSSTLDSNTCISVDIDMYQWGHMFRDNVQYGYCNFSQAQSFFQDIYFHADNKPVNSIFSAHVNISPEKNNGIRERNDGLYMECFTISPDSGNMLKKHTNGYFVQDVNHSHDNIEVLDSCSEIEGELAYKGNKLSSLYAEKEYTEQELMDMVSLLWIKIDSEMAGEA